LIFGTHPDPSAIDFGAAQSAVLFCWFDRFLLHKGDFEYRSSVCFLLAFFTFTGLE